MPSLNADRVSPVVGVGNSAFGRVWTTTSEAVKFASSWATYQDSKMKFKFGLFVILCLYPVTPSSPYVVFPRISRPRSVKIPQRTPSNDLSILISPEEVSHPLPGYTTNQPNAPMTNLPLKWQRVGPAGQASPGAWRCWSAMVLADLECFA